MNRLVKCLAAAGLVPVEICMPPELYPPVRGGALGCQGSSTVFLRKISMHAYGEGWEIGWVSLACKKG